MNIKHIALVYPSHDFSTFDVAVGYKRAFERIGLGVTPINLNQMLKEWGMLAKPLQRGEEWVRQRASADALFMAIQCQPDLVVIIDGTKLHESFWPWTRRLGLATAAVLVDCPYYDDINSYVVGQSDYAFANDRLSATRMEIPYLPVAYSYDIHRPFEASERYWSDVVFAGTGFPERVEILRAVDWSGIDLKLLGYFELEPDDPLKQYYHGTMSNPEVARYYCGSKLVINMNRDSVDLGGMQRIRERWSVGPRVYEAAACGTPMITQNSISELDMLLQGNFISFETPAELEEQIRWWISDKRSVDRNQMAREARGNIKDHHYISRAIQLLDTI